MCRFLVQKVRSSNLEFWAKLFFSFDCFHGIIVSSDNNSDDNDVE